MSLAARAEVLKLARELDAEPDRLSFLERADEDDVALLRARLHDALDARHRRTFRRLALASQVLPHALTAKIATSYFGPMLCGKVVTELTPERAMKLLPHVPTDFLAESCLYLDPKRAGPILDALPLSVMRPALRELLARREHLTLGRFIGAISEDKLLEVVDEIESAEDLIMIGFFAEQKDRLDVVLSTLSDERTRALLRAALELEMVAETLALTEHLSDGTRKRLANMMADMGDDALRRIAQLIQREDAWSDLVPVFVAMSEHRQRRGAEIIVECGGRDAAAAVVHAAARAGHEDAAGIVLLRALSEGRPPQS